MAYGPYDNGYIWVGGEGGDLIIIDPVNLMILQRVQNFVKGKITSIVFEPCQLIIVATNQGEVKSLSFERFKYIYSEEESDTLLVERQSVPTRDLYP